MSICLSEGVVFLSFVGFIFWEKALLLILKGIHHYQFFRKAYSRMDVEGGGYSSITEAQRRFFNGVFRVCVKKPATGDPLHVLVFVLAPFKEPPFGRHFRKKKNKPNLVVDNFCVAPKEETPLKKKHRARSRQKHAARSPHGCCWATCFTFLLIV